MSFSIVSFPRTQPTAQIPPRGLAASHPVLALSARLTFIKALAEQLEIFTQALTDPDTENPLTHYLLLYLCQGVIHLSEWHTLRVR